MGAVKLGLLRRICGPTKAQREDRAKQDAEVVVLMIERARLKAQAAIDEAERRQATDTAILEMRQASRAASAMTMGAGGLTAQEIAVLPDDERERFLRAVARLPVPAS